jgi:hypothetical protein
LPGLGGIAGPDLLDCAADPRVAIAVGKTLANWRQRKVVLLRGWYAVLTMKDLNFLQTWTRSEL